MIKTCRTGQHQYDTDMHYRCPECQRNAQRRYDAANREARRLAARIGNLTPAQIESQRARARRNNPKRVYIGRVYAGNAKTVAQARAVERAVLPKLYAFKDSQRQERVAQKAALDSVAQTE